MQMAGAIRPKEFLLYRVRIYSGIDKHGILAGKFDVACGNRRDAEDAGIWWAIDNKVKNYRVSVMVVENGYRKAVRVLVVTG